MKKEVFSFISEPEKEIKYLRWLPDTKAKAVLQIMHGMAEHAARYDEFAHFLNEKGIAVYANDHRGHGATAGSIENAGFFANTNGWNIVVQDCKKLTDIIKKENPGIPIFILGHSMGSLIARSYISRFTDELNGVILSGTSYNPSILLMFGKAVANIQHFFAGKKHRSTLLDALSFGNFNIKFKPSRTKFDWLNRDEKQVDLYIKDEYCGFVCTTSFYSDMFSGIINIQKKKIIQHISKKLPVYIISGEMDAVGNFTKGVKKIYELLKNYGIKDITIKLYKDDRHEILNELNKEEVYNDILIWLNKHF